LTTFQEVQLVTRITHRDLQLSRASIGVAGELDLANVAEFKASVRWALERKPALMLIDLTGCEFIDSSVIAALTEHKGASTACGRPFLR
jgi:anti-anti-sigma factor